MRESIVQTILELFKNGREVNIVELSEKDFLLDESQKKQIDHVAVKDQTKRYLRNTVMSVAKGAGYMLRNVKKNTYKAISEPVDYIAEYQKRIRKRDKAIQGVEEFAALMLSQGIPVQMEMRMGGDIDAKDSPTNSIKQVVHPSQKSKKAANH